MTNPSKLNKAIWTHVWRTSPHFSQKKMSVFWLWMTLISTEAPSGIEAPSLTVEERTSLELKTSLDEDEVVSDGVKEKFEETPERALDSSVDSSAELNPEGVSTSAIFLKFCSPRTKTRKTVKRTTRKRSSYLRLLYARIKALGIFFSGNSMALYWAIFSSVILGSSSVTSSLSLRNFLVLCFGIPPIRPIIYGEKNNTDWSDLTNK